MWCENCLNCQTISLHLFIFTHYSLNVCDWCIPDKCQIKSVYISVLQTSPGET